jgi:hypothetical protein
MAKLPFVSLYACLVTQVLGGKLYRHKDNPDDWVSTLTEEALALAAHLYKLPDVDFIYHTGDGATRGIPVMSYNVDRSHPNAGFAVPYVNNWAFRDVSLSLNASMAWASCTAARTVRATSIPRVVWRGTLSDPHAGAIHLSNMANTARYKLHVLSSIHWDVLDAKLTGVRWLSTCDNRSLAVTKGVPIHWVFLAMHTCADTHAWCGTKAGAVACLLHSYQLAILGCAVLVLAQMASSVDNARRRCPDGPITDVNLCSHTNAMNAVTQAQHKHKIPSAKYQQYAALLDIDGNSWSFRCAAK